MPVHRVYGATLASDFPFQVLLAQGTGTPDVTFAALDSRPEAGSWEERDPTYTSPRIGSDGESVCLLYQPGHYEVLSFPQVVDFYLWPARIAGHVHAPALRHLVELHFLGPVFSYWLERRGCPVLHASAVAFGPRAVAFVGHQGGGKSGLAAALLQDGGALLSDDLSALTRRGEETLVQPGFPQMRMWPDEAAFFLERYEDLPLVHPEQSKRWVPAGPTGLGAFQVDAAPLSTLYLLDRRPEADAPIEITRLSPRNAVVELLRHSFTPLLVEAAGLQPGRLDFLAHLVLDVPVKRLSYPTGFTLLPRVAEAIRNDLDRC